MHYTKRLIAEDGSGLRRRDDLFTKLRYFSLVSYDPATLTCHFEPTVKSLHDPSLSDEDVYELTGDDPDLAGLSTGLMFNSDGTQSPEFSTSSFNIVSSAWYKNKTATQLVKDRTAAEHYNNDSSMKPSGCFSWSEEKAVVFDVAPQIPLPKGVAVQSECAMTVPAPGGLDSNMTTQGRALAWQDRWVLSYTCINLDRMFMFDEIFAGMPMGKGDREAILEDVGLKQASGTICFMPRMLATHIHLGGMFVHKISVPLVDLYRVPAVKEYKDYNKQYF